MGKHCKSLQIGPLDNVPTKTFDFTDSRIFSREPGGNLVGPTTPRRGEVKPDGVVQAGRVQAAASSTALEVTCVVEGEGLSLPSDLEPTVITAARGLGSDVDGLLDSVCSRRGQAGPH